MNRISTSKEKMYKIFYDAPTEKVDIFYSLFKKFANDFLITKEVHENFFLAQIVAETGYALNGRRENLNYSCRSLVKIFSRYRRNPKWARRDGRCDGHPANQINIGNIAYANRMGNGNIRSGDGYKFRGGGYFQLTGRGNYQKICDIIQRTINESINADTLVSRITEPRNGLLSALAFWLDNKCYECENIDCVTAKINYHTDSYKKRKKIYQWIAKL